MTLVDHAAARLRVHTQARQEAATQRKLDEILRSRPEADNRLIAAEEAADAELAALGELNRDDRARLEEPDQSSRPHARSTGLDARRRG
ncbi:MAG: low affinity iron permease family protein [Acidimicrobiia bacterium]